MFNKFLLLWIYCLSLVSGMVNTVTIVHFSTTVAHFTGVISNFSAALSKLNFKFSFSLFLLMFSFLTGGIISGFIVNGREFNLKKRYGFILVFLGTALSVMVFLSKENKIYFLLFLAFMMGAQNGLVLSYKGVVIRTTHMTGNITDLGVSLGYYLRNPKDLFTLKKGIISFLNIIVFVTGGILGIFIYSYLEKKFFYLVSILYYAIAIFYFRLRVHYSKYNGGF
ncbi:MAG: DUF1275 domain-containing protein [Fusobacteriaceae bacterium]|jgi:uncharacterized membrane protein YoaK (UPF0700 family)|nr:DUF1275 domain-containing protein [Fusobacteriaceae bacterium]